MGSGGALFHAWQLSAGGGWSGWYSLGGFLTSQPTVARNTAGKLQVFFRGGDNALWTTWQNGANGVGGWSAQTSLSGSWNSHAAVAVNADGRIEVFMRGMDNALWHTWQNTANAGSSWSGWISLGGALTSDPAVVANADGRLEVFVRSVDAGAGGLYHKWQMTPGGAWADYVSLGGAFASDPVVAANADGRLEVFVRGMDNGLNHIWQNAPGGSWSGWESITTVYGVGTISNDPSVGLNRNGALEVFAINGGDLVRIARKTSGGWAAPVDFGGSIIGADPSVGINSDGRLDVFVRATDSVTSYHIYQTSPNDGGWSNWSALDLGTSEQPVASDLFAAQITGTASGTTEMNTLSASSGFASFSMLNKATGLGQVTPQQFTLAFGDFDRDGKSDLYAITRSGWSSANTIVDILSASSGFQRALLTVTTPLGTTTEDQYAFAFGDYDRDGIPDLYFISRSGVPTLPQTNVTILSGASNYQTTLLNKVIQGIGSTTTAQFTFLVGDYDRDGYPDLYMVSRAGWSASKDQEIIILSGASQYQQAFPVITMAGIGQSSDAQFSLALGDYDQDGIPDLYMMSRPLISTWPTTEVLVFSGASNYRTLVANTTTPLPLTTSSTVVFGTGHH
jgi:hypothetical protein